MHELTIAENLLLLVEETARRESAQQVSVIVVAIGELSAIEVDSLIFAFDIVKRGSVAAAARLDIVAVAGIGQCRRCRVEVPMPTLYSACPSCGGNELDILSGRELRVREIQLVCAVG
jgi:hydrogenase nickel incorporation protein HypA/HybF